MEDDDEFGDLYTDVLRPFEPSAVQSQPAAASQFQSRPIDLNVYSDDDDLLYGASDSKKTFAISNSNSNSNLKLSAPTPSQEKTLPDSGARGGFDLNLGSSRILGGGGSGFGGKGLEKGEGVKFPERRVDFMEEEEEDLNIVVEEREIKDDDLVENDADLKDTKRNLYGAAEPKESTASFMDQSTVGEMGSEPMIPGLSGRVDNRGGSNFDDEWESEESEDDLQIVLNDNHGPIGMERMPGVAGDDEDDEDGEPLVIVADNGDAAHHHHHQQMMIDEQEWGGEEGGSGADGEKKELGDAAKASGGGGGTATPAVVQPKVGYSNHMYHHPYHSQFKYVRPGVAPLPGAAPPVATGGIQGQVRPPTTMGTVGGRGRGDWRPAGVKGTGPMQKGFHPGYGMPAWGANTAGRGYGSGLDFTLPSHKTIFEVDIDGFEEKPWKLPGIDVSDFFNFGLNEESWKDYCKQLEQLRLETTMQSKIRVYESGRAEQDYDPDLPPELAAAVGGQDISSENANHGKTDTGPTDLARSSARGRPPVFIGRPIPVESGSGDRLPSIDTRRPRMHDSDAIIEIVCQSSTDDPEAETDNEPTGEDLGGVDEIDDPQQDDAEQVDHFSRTYNSPKREPVARRVLDKSTASGDETGREEDLHLTSEVQYQTERVIDISHEDRSSKGRGPPKSPDMTTRDSNGEKQTVDDQNESFNSENDKQNPPLSSPHTVGSDEEQAVALGDVVEDSVMDDRGSDIEKDEMAVDATTSDGIEDGKLMHSTNKGKISSHVEQLSQENDEGEEAARSSENSKARSESSKDHRKSLDHFEDEVVQERHPRSGVPKRTVGEENVRRKGRQERDETGRHNMSVKGREDSHSHRGGDPNSSLHRQMKSDGADRRRDSDISEGGWRRRDEDLHGRRIRVEDTRKRENSGEIGSKNWVKVRESGRSEKDERHHMKNELDNSSWRGVNHDQDLASRQRDRDDNLRNWEEKVGDLHYRRRKEATPIIREHAEKEDAAHNYREGSSHRKRERDDSSDRRKRDDYAKLKDDDGHYARQKREGSIQKERGERQRDRDEWHRPKQSHEEIYSRREREETRPIMRSARTAEDKTWTSHSRGKDDHKVSGRENRSKDVGRSGDQLKRRDRVENEKFSQHRGHEDVHARGNQVSDEEKRARSVRSGTNDERTVYASESSRLREHRQKEGSRKSKEFESGDHNSLIHSKRNEDAHSGPMSEKVNTRGRTERDSGKDDVHTSRQSSRRHREEASSDDEQTGARKGRSKLERWTSHKDSDYSTTSMSSSSLKKSKDLHTHNNVAASVGSKLPEEPSTKGEDKPRPSVDDKDSTVETNTAAKAVDEKHLDTVAKLKKRSERFKLPMPSEKDAVSIKKMESEPLPSVQTENHQDSEIKSERPARKRRWTGN